MRKLNPGWQLLEVEHTPMHVGALLQFEKPKGADAHYVHKMAQSMASHKPSVAPWNLCLHRGWLNRLQPSWEVAREVDLEYHFRRSALPAPGGERELGELVSRLHSKTLDMTRPLWECHLIEGLHGNRFAFYVKVHRLLVGETGSMPLLARVLSEAAERVDMPPMWTKGFAAPAPGGVWTLFGAEDGADMLRKFAGTGLGLLRAGLQRGNPLRSAWPVPRSALNVRITAQRRFATQQYERARLQRVAQLAGESEAVLLYYLCGSALRRFFKEYNALPGQSLIAAVPVDSTEVSSGFIHVSMGTRYADPVDRLDDIRRSLAVAKAQLRTATPGLLPSYAMLVELPYLLGQVSQVGPWLPPTFNLSLNRLQVSKQPLYYNAARLQALYAMPSLLQGEALSITFVSYAGHLHVGLMGAREALPHLQRMAVYMGLALDELEELLAASHTQPGNTQQGNAA